MTSCAHCGRPCNPEEGRYGQINGFYLCHPQRPDVHPDCYQLVSRRLIPLGLPLRRPDQCTVSDVVGGIRVCCPNTAVVEEIVDDTSCMDRGQSHTSVHRYCAAHKPRSSVY